MISMTIQTNCIISARTAETTAILSTIAVLSINTAEAALHIGINVCLPAVIIE